MKRISEKQLKKACEILGKIHELRTELGRLCGETDNTDFDSTAASLDEAAIEMEEAIDLIENPEHQERDQYGAY